MGSTPILASLSGMGGTIRVSFSLVAATPCCRFSGGRAAAQNT
ncbi:hypothetical protein [Pannonibacter phragmitetus]|nr:hypothetical protein [Pannonibacter phragmitetus]